MRALVPAVLIALLALVAAAPATAGPAAQLYPINLRVNGGEAGWHPDNDFRLDWDRPPAAAGFPIAATHYRVRDASGATVIPATRLPWDKPEIDHIHLPAVPGVYTAEVWLEGPGRELGPSVRAALRFDSAAPGPVQPRVSPGWISGDAPALVRLERPAGPLPISGIRGYAISVDRGAGTSPCAVQGRCALGETDIRGGPSRTPPR